MVINMNVLRTQMDRNGRILIPLEFRKLYNMHPGDSFILRAENDSLRVLNIDKVVEEMRALFYKHKKPVAGESIVDDFLAERRKEALLEQKKFDDRK